MKGVKPVLSEFERVCLFLKSIYVAEGKEYVFYEGGVMELGLTRDSTCGVGSVRSARQPHELEVGSSNLPPTTKP